MPELPPHPPLDSSSDLPPDPYGWGAELRESLADPALTLLGSGATAPSEAQHAAWNVARALGYCAYYGTDVGDAAGILDVPLARAAAAELSLLARQQLELLDELEEAWDAADSPEEQDDIVAGPLELRMDGFVVVRTLSEALDAAFDRADEKAESLADQLGDLAAPLRAWDQQLKTQLDLLSLVVDLPLLDNWHAAGKVHNAGRMPWWLDGTLETAARRIRDEARSSFRRHPPRDATGTPASPRSQARRGTLPMPADPRFLAAATSGEDVRSEHLRWRAPKPSPATPPPVPDSPAGASASGPWASLTIRVHPPLAAEERIVVLFLDGDRAAGPAVGERIRLGELETRLDERRRAVFSYGNVARAQAAGESWWRLCVGDAAVEWPLEDGVSEE